MRHHRWTRVLALLLPLALFAAACGSDSSSVSSDTTTGGTSKDLKVGIVYDLGGRGDQSFNDAAAAGLDKAVKEFGLSKPKELEPNQGGENRAQLLRLLAEDNTNLVVAVGFLFADSVKATAPEFTDSTFAIVDETVDAPNVASLKFAEEQGSYLVGAAAALTSKTGKLGFIGGVETPLIKKFEAGFVAGAKKVNPNATVDVKYISQPPDFSGFNDPAKGKEIANGQYAGGADVIYAAAGGSGGGLFEAAKATSTAAAKHWAIGVDSDQYNLVDASLKPFILTSMLKKVDVAVYQTVKAMVEGETVGGKETIFDLKSDGVGYSTSGDNIAPDVVTQIETLKKQIIDGSIKVPTA
ncbi:MAG: Membrane lipoprotein TmpC [Acidimicrobiales bacterium]|nr:Membrane lipoprotein TmpC [Acidimicrobiales bacterium]